MIELDPNFVREPKGQQSPEDTAEFKKKMRQLYPQMDMDYFNNQQQLDRELTGEAFHGQIICAREGKTKTEKQVLEVAFMVNVNNAWYYLNTNIFCNDFHHPEKQSEELHDFLCLALAQDQNALKNSFDFYGKTYYPKLCGLKFLIVGGLVLNEKTGKAYSKFYYFRPDTFSQAEIETNAPKPLEFASKLAFLEKKYKEYKSQQFTPQNNYGNNRQFGNAQQQQRAPNKQPNDDLPF